MDRVALHTIIQAFFFKGSSKKLNLTYNLLVRSHEEMENCEQDIFNIKINDYENSKRVFN